MAKKKTQFKGAKYKDGILSYNYLGGKGGKGGGNVSIKQQGDDWYFVGKDGEIRTDVGDAGKLTPTHMKNLRDDGIFDAVPKEKLPVNSGGKIDPNPGGAKPPVELAESNYSLPETSAPASQASKDFTPVTGDPTAKRSGAIAENAPATFVSAPTAASGINPNEATRTFAPASGGVTTSNFGGGREMGIGNNTFSGNGSEFEARTGTARLPSEDFDANTVGQGNYGSTFQKYEGAGQMSLGNQNKGNVIAPPQKLAGQNEFTGFGKDRMSGPSFSSPVEAIAPGVDQKNLVVGTGGGTWDVDSDYYMKDGQVMKDSGWFGGDDTVATQADIDAGIKDQASPGMTSAEGWNAAGSVMKGIGGLASAYTGIKNYQLARDAHNTQKNQWQADYNQRLKAYGDNKALLNEEIAAKNRILKARGQAESYKSI